MVGVAAAQTNRNHGERRNGGRARGNLSSGRIRTRHYYETDEYKHFNANIVAEFRANGGKVAACSRAPAPALDDHGRQGRPAAHAPLAYTTDNGRLVVIASKGGAPTNPDWFHNLRVNPEVTVEVGTERFPARASIPEGAERQRLFDQMAAQMPGFAEYQRNTTRQLR